MDWKLSNSQMLVSNGENQLPRARDQAKRFFRVEVAGAVAAAAGIAAHIIKIKPHSSNKKTLEMLCYYFAGWASLDELQTHINNLKAGQI